MKKLLILPALLMLTAGCGEQPNKIKSNQTYTMVYVDTLDINGHPHEFLINQDTYRGSQIMHSPECWCGKEVVK